MCNYLLNDIMMSYRSKVVHFNSSSVCAPESVPIFTWFMLEYIILTIQSVLLLQDHRAAPSHLINPHSSHPIAPTTSCKMTISKLFNQGFKCFRGQLPLSANPSRLWIKLCFVIKGETHWESVLKGELGWPRGQGQAQGYTQGQETPGKLPDHERDSPEVLHVFRWPPPGLCPLVTMETCVQHMPRGGVWTKWPWRPTAPLDGRYNYGLSE